MGEEGLVRMGLGGEEGGATIRMESETSELIH